MSGCICRPQYTAPVCRSRALQPNISMRQSVERGVNFRRRARGGNNKTGAEAEQPTPKSDTENGAQDFSLPLQTTASLVLTNDKASKVSNKQGRTTRPLGSGVQNATYRYSLPSPTLAVRNLIEGAHYAHLCTNMSNMHHRRAGYPFGMLVDFAADGAGYPIFCLSPLSIHSHNLREDPRCSLVVQMPGWTGLSNARITLFGDVYELPNEMQEAAKEIFLSKHSTGNGDRVIADNHRFYRMQRVLDIYFVGGFGTVQWIDIAEYAATKPDAIVLNNPLETVDALTQQYGKHLASFFGYCATLNAIETAFISIDATGADVRIRHQQEVTVHRLSFDQKVYTPEDATVAVAKALSV